LVFNAFNDYSLHLQVRLPYLSLIIDNTTYYKQHMKELKESGKLQRDRDRGYISFRLRDYINPCPTI